MLSFDQRRVALLTAMLMLGSSHSPTHSLGAQVPWKLVEELRIGGAESGPASLNEIREIAVDTKGQIYILDYQTQEIRLFSAAGKFVKLVGRIGAGPGEYRKPNGIHLAPDGKLWVHDLGNQRFDIYNADGSYAKQIRFNNAQGDFRWDATFDVNGLMMQPIWSGPDNNRREVIERLNATTGKWDSLPKPSCSMPAEPETQTMWTYDIPPHGAGAVMIPFVPKAVGHLDSAGWWCSAAATYHLKLMPLEGSQAIADITHASSAVPIPAVRRDSAIAEIRKRIASLPAGTVDLSKMPRFFATFDGLNVDEKGNLWASRPGTDGPMLDIWSRTGTLLGTAKAPRTINFYVPTIIRNEKLYLVMQSDDGEPFVVRYRVVR